MGEARGKTILSLCDYSGEWCKPYRHAGYKVLQLDLKRGQDVRLLEHLNEPIHGILAAPPCTAFAVSGAQYWKAKDESGETFAALALVDACLRAVAIYQPRFWALENPVGRLRKFLGAPRLIFDPCDFGDAYTKKTLLWGSFNLPERTPVSPVRVCPQGSWLQRLGGKGEKTKTLRSVTPAGFANAFYLANL